MGENSELISRILDIEWNMFTTVNNEGGRAACQDDRLTFEVMRRSQFEAWDRDSLESYYADLTAAVDAGRNLITEKYAHMMASTAPLQYAAIRDRLPMPDAEAVKLADEICGILLRQTEAYAEQFPVMALQGRPLYASEDGDGFTSVETYQKGELYTYSSATLEKLLACIRAKEAAGVNFAREILERTVARYGFSSLEDAERTVAAQAGS